MLDTYTSAHTSFTTAHLQLHNCVAIVGQGDVQPAQQRAAGAPALALAVLALAPHVDDEQLVQRAEHLCAVAVPLLLRSRHTAVANRLP